MLADQVRQGCLPVIRLLFTLWSQSTMPIQEDVV